MGKFHIRDAQPADQAEIEAITIAAYQQYEAVIGPEHWAAYRQNIVETLAHIAPAEQIVAEQDGLSFQIDWSADRCFHGWISFCN